MSGHLALPRATISWGLYNDITTCPATYPDLSGKITDLTSNKLKSSESIKYR